VQAGQAWQPTCQLDVPINSTDLKSYMAQQCSEGYYGPVCSLCVTGPPHRYGRTGTLQCQPCRSHVAILCAYIGSGIAVLAFLTYQIQVTLKENEEDLQDQQRPVQASELIKVQRCAERSFCLSLMAFHSCFICCHKRATS